MGTPAPTLQDVLDAVKRLDERMVLEVTRLGMRIDAVEKQLATLTTNVKKEVARVDDSIKILRNDVWVHRGRSGCSLQALQCCGRR